MISGFVKHARNYLAKKHVERAITQGDEVELRKAELKRVKSERQHLETIGSIAAERQKVRELKATPLERIHEGFKKAQQTNINNNTNKENPFTLGKNKSPFSK